MKRLSLTAITAILCCLAFFSCRHADAGLPEATFYSLGHDGMMPGVEYVFHPLENVENDSTRCSFSFFLNVRYNENCSLASLPLKIEYGSLDSDSIIEINKNVTLFDAKDHFTGKGNFAVYETIVPLLTNQSYEEGLFFSVSTAEKNTKGIVSLGMNTE